jgi:cysteine-rich repeat protein
MTIASSFIFTGTVDPTTGTFQVSTPPGECGNAELSGTATPDGNSMSGNGAVWLRIPRPPFNCVRLTFTFTAERILCGNGMLDPGETCDDGNRLPFDCCSPTCQLVAAGTPCRGAAGLCDLPETCDGVSQTCPADQVAPAGTSCRAPAGACDVGEVCTGTSPSCPPDLGPPDADGDGVGDLCDPCPGNPRTTVLAKPRLGLASYDAVAGNDEFLLDAVLPLSSAAAAFLDPVTDGLEIAIGAAGDPGSLDVTLPPGAYDPATGQGWKAAKSGREWSFRGADPLLPVTTATIELVLDTAGPRAVVTASGNRRSFAETIPALPLSLRLVLDPPLATSVTCGGAVFSGAGGPPPTCELRSRGTALSCR